MTPGFLAPRPVLKVKEPTEWEVFKYIHTVRILPARPP